MSNEHGVRLKKTSDSPFYEGLIRGKHEVYVDEKEKEPPVGSGEDQEPTPVDYMLWSLASCQAAVLTQCLAKSRVDEFQITVKADIADEEIESVPDSMPSHTGTRIGNIDIDITLEVPEELESRAERCLNVYDQGCIVGQSFRNGIDYDPTTELTVSENYSRR